MITQNVESGCPTIGRTSRSAPALRLREHRGNRDWKNTRAREWDALLRSMANKSYGRDVGCSCHMQELTAVVTFKKDSHKIEGVKISRMKISLLRREDRLKLLREESYFALVGVGEGQLLWLFE